MARKNGKPYRVIDVHRRVVFFRHIKVSRADNTYVAINTKGNEGYYLERHRTDGPAMISLNNNSEQTSLAGRLEWYVNGKICTKPVRDALLAKFGSLNAVLGPEKTDYQLTTEASQFLRDKIGFGV